MTELSIKGASLVAQLVKNPPAMQGTLLQFLGWEDHPGEGIGYPLQYSCLGNPMDEEPGLTESDLT